MQERRHIGRTRVLKGAKIVTNDRASVVDCVLRNLTNAGARVDVASAATLPASFELSMDNMRTSRRCSVIWRRIDAAGVAFAPPDRSGRR